MQRLFVCLAVMSAAVLASASHASSGADWPTRPMTLIVPFPPGGTTDLLARLVARETGQRLGQSMVVENRPGAGGGIGAAAVARARPDGYTLVMGTLGTQVTNPFIYAEVPYDATRDFAPVTLVANTPNVFLVSARQPIASMAQLREQARREPGKLNYASTSLGGSPHLSGELYTKMAGVDIRHVPYKGAAPAMTDLLGGQVHVMIDNLPSAMAQIQAGTVRALAVTTPERVPLLPDVPTVAQAGLPGYEVNAWFGLLAPAGTPAAITQRIQSALAEAFSDPAIRAQVESLGAIPVASTPQVFADIIQSDTAKWRRVISEAAIQPQ